MATIEELFAVIGQPVDSDAVRSLVAADRLVASTEPDLEEGEGVRLLSLMAAGIAP